MSEWKYWTPQHDGHAPEDWVEGLEFQIRGRETGECFHATSDPKPEWLRFVEYRYRPLQDATYEPDLLAQCLALPQDQREALIEAMQKPKMDWADDVWDVASESAGQAASWDYDKAGAAVIRSMCRPKEHQFALLVALRDCRAGLQYVRDNYGDLYGVGFDRALKAADEAIEEATS